MKVHRKLFPEAQSSTNLSENCSGFCDPLCPNNCYPYSQYIFLPPPPPQQPSPPPSPPPELHRTPSYLIISISLLAVFSLLIGYYFFISKSCCRPRADNHGPDEPGEDIEDGFLDENGMDHPIWFITRIGLNQSVINSISVCNYRKGEGLIEGTECSVCLSEFQENETLRLLPKCNHAFHITCIDTWFRSHTNCPLCRAHIVSDSASVGPNIGALNQISRTQSDNHENINNGSSNVNESRESRTETQERSGETGQVIEPTALKEDLDCEPGYNNILKRSFSMDWNKAAKANENGTSDSDVIEVKTDQYGGRSSASSKRMGSSSIAQCLHKSPVSMKRSFSCGGRFFSSRQHRSLNSFLAL